jgi:hypothetical protein
VATPSLASHGIAITVATAKFSFMVQKSKMFENVVHRSRAPVMLNVVKHLGVRAGALSPSKRKVWARWFQPGDPFDYAQGRLFG